MAVKETTNTVTTTTGRWVVFGTNVAVTILLAMFLLVALNWLAYDNNARWDFTGGVAGHRLSPRSQRILDEAGDDLRITTVYASDKPESAREKYFPKVRDLTEEIRQYHHAAAVQHLYSGTDQAKLTARIQEKFGSAAKEYRDAVNLATTVWNELDGSLRPIREQIGALLNSDSWLSGFSTLANIAAVLQKDLKKVEDTGEEVDDLVRGEGIPRYQEANEKIKTVNDELSEHLKQAQDWTKAMHKLVTLLGNPEAEFVKTTRDKMIELSGLILHLRKIAGDPEETTVPEDPKPILQNFAKAALKVSNWLVEESARVNEFVSQYPAIRQHPKWQVQRGIFVMDLTSLVGTTAEDLSSNYQQLRQILQQDVPLDQLQNVVRQLRNISVQIDKDLSRWINNVLDILNEGANIDEPTQAFLAAGSNGELFGPLMERLDEVKKAIDDLPEMEIDEVAKRLDEDNIIVVEKGDQVEVVPFDDVWPIADPFGRLSARSDSGPPRVFDGDSAISNAVMAMTRDKPVAKVVFVTFEEQPPPQMRQFQRPVSGPMPLQAVRLLKEKLEAMQFEVEDWNIAEEGARENKPTAQEGVPMVFVFLPPPLPPPPFQRQQQQQKQFTPEHAEMAREVLAEGGQAIFLSLWYQPMPFGPPPKYGYGDILRADYGIDVDPSRRIIRGVVDRKNPGRFAIDVVQWWYMQLSNFTEQPIGYPLRARRMLMKDVAPVLITENVPENVEVEPVLRVPPSSTDMWAEKDIERIFVALQSGDNEGTFTRSEDAWLPSEVDLTTIVAARNTANDAKVVVMGNGLSLRDDYLQQRVVRFGGEGTRLMTDPPPTENLDLFVNALYWLADQPGLIAAGPAEVPVVGPIADSSRGSLSLVTFGWAAAALVVGGIVMFVRRK